MLFLINIPRLSLAYPSPQGLRANASIFHYRYEADRKEYV